jgi:ABC transporter fused permease/ATP-binding protein
MIEGMSSASRIVGLARAEWRSLALGGVCLAIGSATSLVYPQALRYIVDEAIGRRDASVIDRAVLALLGLFVLQALAVSLRYILFTVAGERVVARLREDLYRAILQQEIAFFDERKTGELTSRLASDTTVLQNTVSVNVSMALRNGVTIIGGIAMLIWTSPPLAALMLTLVPPVALGAVFYGRRVRALSRDVQDSLASASEVAEETIAGMRTVRSFASEPAEVKRYAGVVDKSFQISRRRAITGGLFVGGASLGGFIAIAAVLWYGGRLVLSGALSVGALTSFFIYSLVVAFSLGAVSDVWADFMKASGAASRIFEILDRKPAMPSSGARPEGSLYAVKFANVSFRYPSRPDALVLSDINLTLDPGEIVALVGPSGSGKSTIASLLARLYDPEAGHVELDARDIRELDPDWLRAQIGSVSQEPLLFSSTVADNIRYARPNATDAEVEAAARTANAFDFVSAFPNGFATVVGERGTQLSGGQKQRIAIARAVLKDPRILVLDEATSALDAESEHMVKEALERLMQGRTTLVIAHRLSTVIHANRVVVIDRGKIVQIGDHHSLLAEGGLYKRLVERQFVAA